MSSAEFSSSPALPLDGLTVAFDLDGTLVETAPDLVGTLNDLLALRGLAPLPLSAARSLIGHGARALIQKAMDTHGLTLDPADHDALFQAFLTRYAERIADESRPYPGVEAALERLIALGARLCVCTNKPTGLSVQLLEALNLSRYFQSIIGADSPPAKKPDPGHLIMAVTEAGGDPARMMLVGDSETDVATARNAGVPVITVSFGYTALAPADLGGDILIDHFDALETAVTALAAKKPG